MSPRGRHAVRRRAWLRRHASMLASFGSVADAWTERDKVGGPDPWRRALLLMSLERGGVSWHPGAWA